jgi:hypothetical protein
MPHDDDDMMMVIMMMDDDDDDDDDGGGGGPIALRQPIGRARADASLTLQRLQG